MTEAEKIVYAAQCAGTCHHRPVMVFTDYEKRADWVGDHRTKTGHPVTCWIGVDPARPTPKEKP